MRRGCLDDHETISAAKQSAHYGAELNHRCVLTLFPIVVRLDL